MTFIEKVKRLEGIFAYDSECVGSGIKDDAFKAEMIADPDLEKYLTEMAKLMLNADGYTIEDVVSLLKWAATEMDHDVY